MAIVNQQWFSGKEQRACYCCGRACATFVRSVRQVDRTLSQSDMHVCLECFKRWEMRNDPRVEASY